MSIIYNNKRFIEHKFNNEATFEEEVYANVKNFFGKRTIYINAKKKIESKAIGNSIPDGFLIDLSDIDNPEFYLVEVELSSHSFYNHIFPQITKFFAFFINPTSRKNLVDKLFFLIDQDNELKKEIKQLLGKMEIYKFLTDLIDSSQNILLIIDGDKNELPEIMETYTDTWGKFVKIIKVIKYISNSEYLYYMYPDFEGIEYVQETSPPDKENNSQISENFHLNNALENTIKIYHQLKEKLHEFNTDIVFNPQRYYISIRHDKNYAYIKVRKKKLRIVVMAPEEKLREHMKINRVHSLSASVQGFYNAACAAVYLNDVTGIDELVNFFREYLLSE